MNDLTDKVPACGDAGAAGAAEHPAGEMLPVKRSKVGARARALAGFALVVGAVAVGAGTIDTTAGRFGG
jgi:hypothetical protein